MNTWTVYDVGKWRVEVMTTDGKEKNWGIAYPTYKEETEVPWHVGDGRVTTRLRLPKHVCRWIQKHYHADELERI